MKKILPALPVCLFLAIPFGSLHAHNDIDDVPVNTTQELVDWCRNEVEQRALSQDQTPRNWRASQLVKGNYLHVRLTYRIEYVDKVADCKIRKGAQRRYAVFNDSTE